jgi:hypothetical protein
LLESGPSEAERLVALRRSLTHRRYGSRLIVAEAIVGAFEGLLEDIEVNTERGAMQTTSLGSGTTKVDLIEIHNPIAALQGT